MSDPATEAELAALLRETGERHHEAFAATDGADPEWPLWYAGYLEDRIGDWVGRPPTRSRIVHWLVGAADAHEGTEEPWPTFYARYVVEAAQTGS